MTHPLNDKFQAWRGLKLRAYSRCNSVSFADVGTQAKGSAYVLTKHLMLANVSATQCRNSKYVREK